MNIRKWGSLGSTQRLPTTGTLNGQGLEVYVKETSHSPSLRKWYWNELERQGGEGAVLGKDSLCQ